MFYGRLHRHVTILYYIFGIDFIDMKLTNRTKNKKKSFFDNWFWMWTGRQTPLPPANQPASQQETIRFEAEPRREVSFNFIRSDSPSSIHCSLSLSLCFSYPTNKHRKVSVRHRKQKHQHKKWHDFKVLLVISNWPSVCTLHLSLSIYNTHIRY